jgi:hypothetical protein
MRWAIVVSALALALNGCRDKDRVARQQAEESRRSAERELRNTRESAIIDLSRAQLEAAVAEERAAEEQEKAERLAHEQQRVAGRLPPLEKELRDQLDGGWTVRPHGQGWAATRMEAKRSGVYPASGIDDAIRSFGRAHRDAIALRNGDEVTLRGRIDDCGVTASAARKFAALDGVNRIIIDISCAS